MLINIVSVGSPRSKQVQQLTGEYVGRIRHYAQVSLKAVRPEPMVSDSDSLVLRKEAGRLRELMDKCYNVVLDRDGEMMDSILFAKFLDKRIMAGTRVMNVIIGGPSGIDRSVKQGADKVLSLSHMTFPHELTIVIITEQLYRAFTILHGLPYHR